jgi:hypothetical protein
MSEWLYREDKTKKEPPGAQHGRKAEANAERRAECRAK